MLTLEKLDGTYEVTSRAVADGPFTVNGDGLTEIRNGMTYRKDVHGCIWESAFSIVDKGLVQIESTVDPSHAQGDIYILDEKGNPTRSMVTYRSMLAARIEDGKVVLEGEIRHGGETTQLRLRQL